VTQELRPVVRLQRHQGERHEVSDLVQEPAGAR
jgi:hypothetical protein